MIDYKTKYQIKTRSNGFRTLICHHCKKTFKLPSSLKRHIRFHCIREKRHRNGIEFPLTMTYNNSTTIIKKWCSIHFLSQLFKHVGIKALSYVWLVSNGFRKNYNRAVKGIHKVKLQDLAKQWGVYDEWVKQRRENICKSHNLTNWTDEHFDIISKELLKTHGQIPPASWLRENGYGSYVTTMYNKGWSVQYLQQRYNFQNHHTSRVGIRWRSHPEVCASNFLYSRGIEHKVGEHYPSEYKTQFGRKGIYDMHFIGTIGIYANQWINVEVWGDKPNGADPEHYAKKRHDKETFAKNDQFFLGIHWKDCFNENKMINILKPFIGIISPYVFRDKFDNQVKPVNWSTMDIVIEQCKKIMKHNEDILPGESWMRKRGKYKNREVEEWELTDKSLINFNSLKQYIANVGGFRIIRKLLKTKNKSTRLWTQDTLLSEIRRIYKIHNVSPSTLRSRVKRRHLPKTDPRIKLSRLCSAIVNSCKTHFVGGYREACQLAGIPHRYLSNN
jgi:hypothetical protein